MAMCEMVREAQTRDTPFYMDESNEDCMGGAPWGWCPMSQCEVILGAMAYSTGEMFESKATPVFQCSWLYSYPN